MVVLRARVVAVVVEEEQEQEVSGVPGARASCFSLPELPAPPPLMVLQVYKARLKGSGALVAVKVQRPEALASASVDMFILRRY